MVMQNTKESGDRALIPADCLALLQSGMRKENDCAGVRVQDTVPSSQTCEIIIIVI